MKRIAWYTSLILLGGALSAFAEPAAPGPLWLVEAYRLHDADTLVECRLFAGWGHVLETRPGWRVTIRVANFDSPEVDRVRDAKTTIDEIHSGLEALAALKDLIGDGMLYAQPTGASVYGRLEARVWLWRDGQWTDLAKRMNADGWDREDLRKRNWKHE